ncbi:MAG: hypothetical protein A4E63_01570 [Syntrophorhabdus sp. PtaU1.Bin050]|nr:MAG: hypothetical protein A4E63_01570 [Syntrophorhabdus sp. PtaU1.Bin050]
MESAYPCTGEHGDDQFGDHREIDSDHIAFLDAQVFKHIGKFIYLAVQVEISEDLPVIGVVSFENNGCLVFLCFQVPVEAIVADIQFPAFEPFHMEIIAERPVRNLRLVKRFEPRQPLFRLLRPEGFRVFDRLLVELIVLSPAFDVRLFPHPVRDGKYLVIKIILINGCHCLLLVLQCFTSCSDDNRAFPFFSNLMLG